MAFDQLDLDGNGDISEYEWIRVFDTIDADTNGVISRKEWAVLGGSSSVFDVISNRKLVINKQDWIHAFSMADHNKDGSISAREWSDMPSLLDTAYRTLAGNVHPVPRACGSLGVAHAGEADELASLWQQKASLRDKLRAAESTIRQNDQVLKASRIEALHPESKSRAERLARLRKELNSLLEAEGVTQTRLHEKEREWEQLVKMGAAAKERIGQLDGRTDEQLGIAPRKSCALEKKRLDQTLMQAQERRAQLQARRDSLGQVASKVRTPSFSSSSALGAEIEEAARAQQTLAKTIAEALGPELMSEVERQPFGLYFGTASDEFVHKILLAHYRSNLACEMRIVFVSADPSELRIPNGYLKDRAWLALPTNGATPEETLRSVCGVTALPQLVVFSPECAIMTTQGVSLVRRGAPFPDEWVLKAFVDVNVEPAGVKLERAVVALGIDRQIALAVRAVAKDVLREVGTASAMPLRFFNGAPGKEADELRLLTQVRGDKLVFLDLKQQAFFVCEEQARSINAGRVKQFIVDVLEGRVQRQQPCLAHSSSLGAWI